MLLAGLASTSGSLADPAGSSVLGAAVGWLQATLLGTLATTVAIIAIACVGLMMLTGRVNIRHGLTVIAGSFILFGATTIAAGIQSMAGTGYAGSYAPPPPAAPPAALPALPPANPDPYAGAAMPSR